MSPKSPPPASSPSSFSSHEVLFVQGGCGAATGIYGEGWMVITHWIDAQMDGDSGERVEGYRGG